MNIRFATIDVIQTSNNKLYVMEVNSSVCMTNFIEKTFEKRYNANIPYTYYTYKRKK